MLRKDYIQRQLEEFGKVLSKLAQLKINKDWEAFETEINTAWEKYTGAALAGIDSSGYLDLSAYTYEQKKIMAHLLFERMHFHQEAGEREKYFSMKQKCLALYLHLKEDTTQNEFDLEVHYRIELLSQD